MKIMHIVGNRPQFIKLALLNRALDKRFGPGVIVHTGQHFDQNMSTVFFEELGIPTPHYQLDIHGLARDEMISRMTIGAEPILQKEKPDVVVVYGDTNSTLAGAEAANKPGIPLIHIEAGVRTGDVNMPEEINRRLTDRIAYLNCCCTSVGLENLRKEGQQLTVQGPGAFLSGDLMLDALRYYCKSAGSLKTTFETIDRSRPFVLATIHRVENAENKERLSNIIVALNQIHQQMPVLLPLHPKTRLAIQQLNIPLQINTSPPLGYLDSISLLNDCHSVITDSGGLSREAFFLSKPTLVIMEYPFWPELFEHGNCLQSNALSEEILHKHQLLNDSGKPFKVNIFGDGRAAEKIGDRLQSAF
jgi:UDP-GlcNAc3NAcA epimerase